MGTFWRQTGLGLDFASATYQLWRPDQATFSLCLCALLRKQEIIILGPSLGFVQIQPEQ